MPSGEATPWLHWKGKLEALKSLYYRDRDSDGMIQLISCQQRLGTQPCRLGETQAVTTHRPNSSSWVGRHWQGIEIEGHGREWKRNIRVSG